MAKTIVEVELGFKGQESVAQVEEKTKSLKKELKEMKDLMSAGTLDNKQFKKLSEDAGKLQEKLKETGKSFTPVEEKTKSLKAQLKEMKALLASGTLDSNQFQKLSIEAGNLQDRIGDVNQRVKNLASDSKRLDTVISAAQGIVGGFTAVQGIIALVGTENENLQKTLVKVQGAMAALTGIQAVANALNKDSALMTGLATVKTTAQGIANRFLTATTMESVAATYALRAALIASGVGALVVLLGAAAAAMSKFTDSTKSQKSATDELAQSYEDLKLGMDAEANAIARQDKLNIERSKLRGDALSTQIKIEQSSLQNQLHYGRQEIKRILALRDLYAQGTEDYKKYEEQRAAQAEKNLNIVNDIELSKIRYESAINKEAEDERKKRDEQSKKAREKADAEKLAKIKKDSELAIENANMERDLIASLENEGKEEEEKKRKQAEFEKAYRFQLSIDRYRKEKELNAKELEDWNRTQQAKAQIYQDTTDSIMYLGDVLMGEQFKYSALGKTIAISQIAVDTALAISSLTKNSEANPANAPTSGLAGALQFAAGMLRITASIAKAKAILTSGASPSASGGSTSGGSRSAGVGSMASAPNTSRFVPTTTSGGQSSQRVYVLEKDITDSQGRVAKIRHNATLI